MNVYKYHSGFGDKGVCLTPLLTPSLLLLPLVLAEGP